MNFCLSSWRVEKDFFLLAGKKQRISTAAEVFISFLAFKPGRAFKRGEGPAKIFFTSRGQKY